MLVHGAFVPPSEVIDDVVAVVHSVAVPGSPTIQKQGRRLFGRRTEEAEVDADAPPALEYLPTDRLQVLITEFGNLTTADAYRLVDLLTEAAAGWTAPTVRFAGGTALDFPGDPYVWAKLDGEVDAMAAISRGVTQSVESQGFFVDRRLFRPMMPLANVTETTTGPYLGAVVDALDAFSGQEWRVDAIVLTTGAFVDGKAGMKEFQRIPLG